MGKLFFFITVFFTTALTFSQQVTTVAGYGGGWFLDGPALQALLPRESFPPLPPLPHESFRVVVCWKS